MVKMEDVDAGFKTQLKEAATALLGRSLNVRSGETFRLSWNNLGYGACEIGPKRPQEKGLPHAHINLVDIPEQPKAPRLELMLAVNNLLTLQNNGESPLRVRVPFTDEEHFRFVYTRDFKPRIPEEEGISLEKGEMIEVSLAGHPFIAEWETPSGKVTLKGMDVAVIMPIGTERGLAVSYRLEKS
jgi:hypothetical protein